MDSVGGSKGCSHPMLPPELGGCDHYHHHHHLNPIRKQFLFPFLLKVGLFFTMLSFTFLVLYKHCESPLQIFPTIYSSLSISANYANNDNSRIEELWLRQVLERSALPDKTVIVTTLNEAWIEPDSIFDLFLQSFNVGEAHFLLKHVLVVALDQRAFDHCLKHHLNCYYLETEGVNFSGEAHFMTPDYLKMMWRRLDFLRQILELGYNFVFTDADIMWFRNPFKHFYPEGNFQISCDRYWGNLTNVSNNDPNGGFNYVKSSNETIEFYKFWYKSRENYPGLHDQDVLDKIKHDPYVKEIGLKMKFLDTANFGGFCQPSKDLNLVSTMHANCCAGLDNKIHDLKIMLEDWKKYKSLPEDERENNPTSWTVPQKCGPDSFGHHTPRKRTVDASKSE